MSYFGFTDTGNVRGDNEDAFSLKKISPNLLAAIVADGMGGHSGGKEASHFAVDNMMKEIEANEKKLYKYTDKQLESFLKKTVIKVNDKLFQKSNEDPSLSGMGTTLAICIILHGKYYIANVGDSRVYIYTDTLTQITKDHSYVTELLEMGVITKEQAVNHPNKNIITRAVGTEKEVLPDIYIGDINKSDTIIICTDGLNNMVTDSAISKIISKNTKAKDITSKLVTLAKKNGGTDNITVVAIKGENGGEK